MSKKTALWLNILFLTLGILSLVLPSIVVALTGHTFSKTQTAFFLSASLLSLICVCLTRIIAEYTWKKKINVFLVCAIVVLAVFGVSVWL